MKSTVATLLFLLASSHLCSATPPKYRREPWLLEARDASSSIVSASSINSSYGVPTTAGRSNGHVSTRGEVFELDGQPFYFAGANAYWIMNQTREWTEALFSNASAQGLSVLRTWFFHDGQFQTIVDGKQTFDDGPDGLGHMDYIVATARRYGIKLIATLANNWPDYGGIHYYLENSKSKFRYHDDFFRQEELKSLYKSYVHHVLGRNNTLTGIRYKDEPTFFAFELMNEPRCLGYTEIKSQHCNVEVMTSWIDEMSTFIKKLAPRTLVSVGDEGWFNKPGLEDSWVYDGFNGIDFEANLALPNIDFGTFHTYPDHGWGAGTTGYDLSFEWGEQWIRQHKAVGARVGKPVVNEEYGFNQVADRKSYERLYYAVMEDIGVAGDLFWQLWVAPPDGSPIQEYASENATNTPGLNYYVNSSDFGIIRQHAFNMEQKNLPRGRGNLTCEGAANMFCDL